MLDLQKEKELAALGYARIAGVDEAGRGPLAGPVVAACVIFAPGFQIEGSGLEAVADSKKLTPKKREQLFRIIKEKALAVEIGVADNRTIDRINILQATFLAMRRALKKSPLAADYVLVDGSLKIPGLDKPQTAIVDGDALVFSIAAASIIAKVSRDWLMTEADQEYPRYGFAKHKGYGTKAHLAALEEYGPCPLHRLSFAPLKKRS